MTRSDSKADASRVAQCASGDGHAIEELYAEYAGSCLALARSILVDPHHAEDAVQEAFLDLWRHPDRFDSRQSSARSWLLLLTHRKAVDRVRSEERRKTSALLPGDDKEDERPGPDVQALTSLTGDRTREALALLPPAKREAIVLAYWGGYTQREIAGLTSTPIGTVKSRMYSALRELRASLLSNPVPLPVDDPPGDCQRIAPTRLARRRQDQEVEQGSGRVLGDRYLHALTETLPAYAICGAGMIVARVGLPLPMEDAAACPACVKVVRCKSA